MKHILPVLILSVGCATVRVRQPCVTTCGMRLLGSYDCEGFQDAEVRSRVVLEDLGRDDACDRMNGWVVQVMPEAKVNRDGLFELASGRWGRGVSYCYPKVLQVATDDWRASSLAHELAHVIDCPFGSNNHLGWDSRSTWQGEYLARVGARR